MIEHLGISKNVNIIVMNNDIVKYWAELIEMEHMDSFKHMNPSVYLNESNTPTDDESLEKSFNADVSDEKLTPTVEFLKKMYGIFNKRFFENHLISEDKLLFKIISSPRTEFVGCAGYHINRYDNTITPTCITLNAAFTLTLHEWMEVIVHEMIHILDYQNNPKHFTSFFPPYDPHGSWFMSVGEQFKKDGFNIERTCNRKLGINTEDPKLSNKIKSTSFLQLEGYKNAIICVSDKDIEKTVEFLMEGAKRNRYPGLKSINVLKSSNPEIIRIPKCKMRNSYSAFSFYNFDKFNENWGPFEEIRKYEVMKEVNEDRDEVEYDDMNHIDDEYARKIYDNIKGVVNIKKIDDEQYEVSIW